MNAAGNGSDSQPACRKVSPVPVNDLPNARLIRVWMDEERHKHANDLDGLHQPLILGIRTWMPGGMVNVLAD